MKPGALRTGLLALFAMSALHAQQAPKFGELTNEERQFERYEPDTSAVAVYLYERGENYFEIDADRIWLFKKYHAKIKILKEQGIGRGNVSIPFYRGDGTSEVLKDVHAMTHNGGVRTGLPQDAFFQKDRSEHWSEVAFAFPNVQVGAVLEYTYTLRSPFIYNFNGWDFQDDIPKVYTEFNALIPGNYEYNRDLVGPLKLEVNEATLEKACLSHPAFQKAPDCEKLRYAMRNVPAFVEEPFMLAAHNFRSRISFELSKLQQFDGRVKRYTQSWEDVDKDLRNRADLGRQLNKENFFQKQLPAALLQSGTPLERAQNIYRFVRDYYTWNGDYGFLDNTRVKEAFERKSGNVGEINMTLINLLNAAGISSQLVLCATRQRGLPKLGHPVITDFNYMLARAEIDGEVYYLDATEDSNPFGMIPFRALNYYGRVMDFQNDSYWEDFNVKERNLLSVRAQMQFGEDPGMANGVAYRISTGYDGVQAQEELRSLGEDAYAEQARKSSGVDLQLTGYSVDAEKSDERTLHERFAFTMPNTANGNLLYLDPFVIRFFSENPFRITDRTYPVDFGYNRNYSYSMSIPVPDGYRVEDLPRDQNRELPDQLGRLTFKVGQQGNNLLLNFNLNLNTAHFPVAYYPELRQLFDTAVQVQTKSLIVLKKI